MAKFFLTLLALALALTAVVPLLAQARDTVAPSRKSYANQRFVKFDVASAAGYARLIALAERSERLQLNRRQHGRDTTALLDDVMDIWADTVSTDDVSKAATPTTSGTVLARVSEALLIELRRDIIHAATDGGDDGDGHFHSIVTLVDDVDAEIERERAFTASTSTREFLNDDGTPIAERVAARVQQLQQEQQEQQAQQRKFDDEQLQPPQSKRSLLAAASDAWYSQYHSSGEITTELWALAQAYPSLCTMRTVVSRTAMGNVVYALRVASPSNTSRKVVWWQSGLHAREWITSSSTMYMLKYILSSTDAAIVAMRESVVLYIVPMMNPDGYDYSRTTDRMWRKNVSPLQGSDCVGVDLNRNWNVAFGQGSASYEACSELYTGPMPFSEAETQGVRTFWISMAAAGQEDIVAAVDYHSYGQKIVRPPGYDSSIAVDEASLKAASEATATGIAASRGTVYTSHRVAEVYFAAGGAADDWFHQTAYAREFGATSRVAMTIEGPPLDGQFGSFVVADQFIIPTGLDMVGGIVALTQHMTGISSGNGVTPTPVPTPVPTLTPTPTPVTLTTEWSLFQTVSSTEQLTLSTFDHCAAFTQYGHQLTMRITMGSNVDYYRPLVGLSLCQLLATEPGSKYRWSPTSLDRDWMLTRQATFGHLLGGGHAPGDGREYSPFWGARDANGNLGGCGHTSTTDAFACGRAYTMHVRVDVPFESTWQVYANFDGKVSVTAAMYAAGVGSPGDANYAAPCASLDAYPGNKLRLRLRMGQYADYLYPAGDGAAAQTFCTMLSTPGTWFWHSSALAGPYTARNGVHAALLGGWLYGDASPAPEGDGRTWGSFWGTHLYFEETGGCCHGLRNADRSADALGFLRPFSWEWAPA